MKVTPRPWTAHDDYGTGTLPCVLSDKVNAGGNFYVAQCNVFADAVLIATAPELLDLLKSAIARVELANAEGNNILSAWLPDAKAIVTKIEGEGGKP